MQTFQAIIKILHFNNAECLLPASASSASGEIRQAFLRLREASPWDWAGERQFQNHWNKPLVYSCHTLISMYSLVKKGDL